MFKRVAYEEWAVLVVTISFVLVTFVFVVGSIRAFRLSKTKREHLAALPLDDPAPPPPSEPVTSTTTPL